MRKMRLTNARGRLVALFVVAAIGAVTMVALTSSAERSVTKVAPHLDSSIFQQDNIAQRNGFDYKPTTSRQNLSLLSQEKGEAAQRIDDASETMKPVKPTIFHGDLRRLPLKKPVVEEERPEPQEPPDELPVTVPGKVQQDKAMH